MPQLYISKGDYVATPDDILDTLNGGSSAGGDLIFGGDIYFQAHTANYGVLTHFNTGARVYTFPNATGNVALLSNPQTWSGLQTYNTGTIKVNDLLFATGTRSITQTAGNYQFKTESGSVYQVMIAGAVEYTFTSTTLDLGQNILSNVALIQGVTTSNDIDDTIAGWIYDVATGNKHVFRINSVEWINIGSNNDIRFLSTNNLVLQVASSKIIYFDDGVSADRVRIKYEQANDDFSPVDNVASLGKSGRRWVDVWAVNGTIQTSFTKFKQNINNFDHRTCLEICKKLEPITFEWKDETFDGMKEEQKNKQMGKKHFGFNADALLTDCPDAVAGEDGIYTASVLAIALGAIKNLDSRVEKLEKTP